MKTNESITFDVPTAPEIPGLRFRRYLGEADIPAIVAITNAANKADDIKEYESVEDYITLYKTLRNTDMEKDIYIAEVSGEMIGFGRTAWEELQIENIFTYHTSFVVHPSWRGKGIGRAIQPVLEARAIELSKTHRNDADKFIESWSGETEVSKVKLLKRFGYAPARYFFEMKRDLNNPINTAAMPEGLEIRPVTEDQLPTIHAGLYEAFRDHWGHADPKEGDLERWIERVLTIPAYSPARWVVVWDGVEMAGLIMNGIHEEANAELGLNEGWMHTIGVRRPWRKRGLASAMIVESMNLFKSWGLDVAALGVDTNNPNGALGLYERHGFKQSDKWTTWRKEIITP